MRENAKRDKSAIRARQGARISGEIFREGGMREREEKDETVDGAKPPERGEGNAPMTNEPVSLAARITAPSTGSTSRAQVGFNERRDRKHDGQ